MGDKTGIEWTDATWNPTVGCSLVSAGCTNCYAMDQAHRFSGEGQYYEGLTRVSGGRPVWTGKVTLKPHKLGQPLRWTRPRRIFVNSMSDLFHEEIPFEYIAACFGVMAASPEHQFQVLTKRPQRAQEFFDWLRDEVWPETDPAGYRNFLCNTAARYLDNGSTEDYSRWSDILINKTEEGTAPLVWPLRNVWLGVSVEDQEAADARIELLTKLPGAVRFLSCEPLIGPVTLGEGLSQLDWVIVGGESGPRSRPCDQVWVEALLEQCREADVDFFFKQKGEVWARECGATSKKGGDISEFPEHLRVRELPQRA